MIIKILLKIKKENVMKKYFAIAMMVCTMATLTACGGGEQKPADQGNQTTQTQEQKPAENKDGEKKDGEKKDEQKTETADNKAVEGTQVLVLKDESAKPENLPTISVDKASKKFIFEYTSADNKSYTVNGDVKDEDGKLTLSSEADKFELVLKYLSDDLLKYSENESKPIEFADGTKLELKSNAEFSVKK
jgi:hypothetical protein